MSAKMCKALITFMQSPLSVDLLHSHVFPQRPSSMLVGAGLHYTHILTEHAKNLLYSYGMESFKNQLFKILFSLSFKLTTLLFFSGS